MGHYARRKETRREGTTQGGTRPQQRTEGGKDRAGGGRAQQPSAAGVETGAHRNEVRRLKYALDPEYAERAKQTSRDSYRKDKPLAPSKLSNGLLEEGVQREVLAGDMDAPMFAATFTVPEAAKALGKSELTVKRWIKEGLIPPPVLRDTRRGYLHYSEGELAVLARELAKHEKHMAYYSLAHEVTQHAIWQALQAYRATGI